MTFTETRTRFAPSPTGFQHIGGFRTAVYAWLLAKSQQGKFVLRIEDTDKDRKVDGAVKFIMESLDWLGIDIDEGPSSADLQAIGEESGHDIGGPFGPYVQSLRLEKYQNIANQLIESGHAFRCDCTKEMLDKERSEQMARKETPGYSGYCRKRNVSADSDHVVRLEIPLGLKVQTEDAVRGFINWENPPLRDPVILKGDGYPTYHLASVVDDHEMKISHVLRGEEWISTTPIHLLLYDTLGWDRPSFCHLSHILGTDGKKLGKRNGAESLDYFVKEGYLPEAILNYIVQIGWSPGKGDEQEIFTIEELIKKFSLKTLNKSSGVYDIAKLQWMNGIFMRNLPVEKFNDIVIPYLEDTFSKFDISKWNLIASDVQERVKSHLEVPEIVSFLFEDEISRDMDSMLNKKVDATKARTILSSVHKAFQSDDDFSLTSIEASLKGVAKELEEKAGPVFISVRIAVTGSKTTPPLFDSIFALGKERTLGRIDEALSLLEEL